MEVENITKTATFKSFLLLSYKNTQLLFLQIMLFNIFMIQTLTDDFWGLTQKFELRVSFNISFNFINKKEDQISFRVWSHLLKISLMENFLFCAVSEGRLQQQISSKQSIFTFPLVQDPHFEVIL